MGTVEPALENAAEALDGERVGDSGRGLEGVLELEDMADRRFIQDGRVRRLKRGPRSEAMPPSLPGVVLRSWSVLRCAAASLVVSLLTLPDSVRPS